MPRVTALDLPMYTYTSPSISRPAYDLLSRANFLLHIALKLWAANIQLPLFLQVVGGEPMNCVCFELYNTFNNMIKYSLHVFSASIEQYVWTCWATSIFFIVFFFFFFFKIGSFFSFALDEWESKKRFAFMWKRRWYVARVDSSIASLRYIGFVRRITVAMSLHAVYDL